MRPSALIFQAGFSTMDVATELSGRGVGMDVVKTSISKLSGFVEVKTRKDEGTTFRINIPLTLAIIQALMVRTAGVQYAVPLSLIEEIVRVAPDEIAMAGGRRVFVLRGKGSFPSSSFRSCSGRDARRRARSGTPSSWPSAKPASASPSTSCSARRKWSSSRSRGS